MIKKRGPLSRPLCIRWRIHAAVLVNIGRERRLRTFMSEPVARETNK
jgi:hypothetical protein